MLRLLPPNEVQTYVINRLTHLQGPMNANDSLWMTLMELPKPWSPALEEALLKRVQLSLLNWANLTDTYYRGQEQLSLFEFGCALPVSLLYSIPQTIIEKYRAPNHPLREAFDGMITTLELRAKMHSVFSAGTK